MTTFRLLSQAHMKIDPFPDEHNGLFRRFCFVSGTLHCVNEHGGLMRSLLLLVINSNGTLEVNRTTKNNPQKKIHSILLHKMLYAMIYQIDSDASHQF